MNNLPKHFSLVSDIEVPDRLFVPISTGVSEIDETFSSIGGVIPSQVTLMTGKPSAGKTTLCSYIGAMVTKHNKAPAAFLSYEMSDFQLKLQANKISGFSDMVITSYPFYKEPNGLDEIFKSLDMIQPSIVMVDSLQKMASQMAEGPNRGQIVLVEKFTAWSKKTFIPVILIGHNSKGGDYSGPSFLEHEVDSHLRVEFDKETGDRFFYMKKNRFGGNASEYNFKISDNGVQVGWPKYEEEDFDLTSAISEFKSEGFTDAGFKKIATGLIGYLNDKHQEDFSNSYIENSSKVHIVWDRQHIYCDSKSGKIVLSSAAFQEWDKIAYVTEKPYMSKYASTKETVAIWKIIHEWMHLFNGYQRHSGKLWKKVSEIAEQEKWLWD